jgi:integrase
MTRIKLKYVEQFIDRHGKPRFYFRRAGYKRTPLPGLPGSAEFMEAYQAALDGLGAQRAHIGAARTKPGTVNAAIAAFYTRCNSYLDNRPITQRTDRNILEAFRAKHGSKPIALLEQKHIENMLAEKSGKPAAQRNLLRVLRTLLAFCVKDGLRKDNPALGIKLVSTKTTGYHTWTEEELRQFEERHPVGTKAHLALAVLLYTAQRRSDVVRLGPMNIVTRGGIQRLVFTQSKTGSEMDIPLAAPLAQVIAATPMVGVKTFLVTDYGRPFTAAGFGGWFRAKCDQAGLKHCSAHGLRKAFLRRMAEAGCSEDYIASISGHRDMDEIRSYVRAANKQRMADEGMAKTLARFPAAERGTS